MARKIPVSVAKVGDVLAEPVRHGHGQVLLREGTELDASQIDMLRQRGVALLTIVTEDAEDADAAPPRELDPEELKAILVHEGRWFGETRRSPVMAEVFRYAVQRRARERQSQT